MRSRSMMLLIFLTIFSSFVLPGRAQSYDPFDGNRQNFHVKLSRYFESRETELRQRKQLFNEVDQFIQDSLWKADNLLKHLDANELLGARLKKHEQYYRLLGYINNKDTAARRSRGAIGEKINTLNSFTARRIQLKEIRSLSETKSMQLGLGKYAHWLREVNKSSLHDLSDREEILVDQLSGTMLDHLTDRYDNLMDLVTADDILAGDGKKLNPIVDRTLILKNKDAGIRKAGTIAYNNAYSNHGEVLAAVLIDITREKAILARIRGYKSAPERSYDKKLQLSESNVKQLLREITLHADVLKRYQRLQQQAVTKLTGSERVNSYDLSFTGGYTWQPRSYTEIRHLISKALEPLGVEYQKEFSWLLEPGNGALEIAGGPDRVNENTSIGYANTPVSLYMKSYNGSLSDVLRLSHEGGHAIHMKLMGGHVEVPSYSSGPSFLFEAFAMLNELLVLDELEKEAPTYEIKAYYTRQFLNKLAHEVFTSAEEGAFEQELYEGIAANNINTRNNVDSLYAGIMDQYDLFFAGEPERKSEWINKRLLFDDPLYNINYLYAILVTCKLYDQLHKDPKTFAASYAALLKNGFDQPAEELLFKFMGFKLDHQALLNSALILMESKTEALSRLIR